VGAAATAGFAACATGVVSGMVDATRLMIRAS
jgi:hypothetical protein